MDGDEYLFPFERLTNLSKWAQISNRLTQVNVHARPLKLTDYQHGYLQLLEQLTQVGSVSEQQFEARFQQMKEINQVREHYLIVVIVDNETSNIVAASTFFLEYKFIHQCANRARLEDVAVLETHRRKNIGEIVVSIIVELAKEPFQCYKLSLDCSDELKRFYAKNGFSHGCNMLSIRFEHDK